MAATPQEKSLERRRVGELAPDAANDRATDKALLALCRKFQGKSDNSQSTMALGIFEKGSAKVILVALQQGAKANGLVLDHLMKSSPKYKAYKIAKISLVPPAPGLHAEMMIVRELMIQGALRADDIDGSAAKIKLRIACPEKLVCPDCAGYLRKHGIPHYPVYCGAASPNWVNPRTGACFRATEEGGVTFYFKLPDIMSGNPVDANSGNLGPLLRVGG